MNAAYAAACAVLLFPALAHACVLHATATSEVIRHERASVSEVHIEVEITNRGATACGAPRRSLPDSGAATSIPIPLVMALTPLTAVSGPAVLINATGTPTQRLAGTSNRALGLFMAASRSNAGQCGPHGPPVVIADQMLSPHALCQWDGIAPGQSVSAHAFFIAGDSATEPRCTEGVIVMPGDQEEQDPAMLPILQRWSTCKPEVDSAEGGLE